jgi:hypothetical protein
MNPELRYFEWEIEQAECDLQEARRKCALVKRATELANCPYAPVTQRFDWGCFWTFFSSVVGERHGPNRSLFGCLPSQIAGHKEAVRCLQVIRDGIGYFNDSDPASEVK